MACYLLAAAALACALVAKSWAPVLRASVAAALGMGLTGIYLLPVAAEQSWADLKEVTLEPGQILENNWLFARHADPVLSLHDQVLLQVSVIAVAMTAVALVCLLVSLLRGRLPGARSWWVPLALIPPAVLILQFPLSRPLWNALPELRFLQFPWRWLLVLDVPFSLCLAAAMGRLRGATRFAACAGALAGLALTGFLLTRSNWWDSGGAADFFEEHFRNGAGYFGVDEYGPRGSDHYDLDQKAPLVGFRSGEETTAGTNARAQVLDWGPAHKEFRVDSAEPVLAALRVLNYPAWRVEVNGRPVSALSDEHTGQMLIALPAGNSRVGVTFITTRDRRLGDVVSALALVGLLLVALAYRRPRLPAS